MTNNVHFNPQGPRGPRLTVSLSLTSFTALISIHKALAGLDKGNRYQNVSFVISIHKALAGLDFKYRRCRAEYINFNPQGPRGPRPMGRYSSHLLLRISIHKALAGLDEKDCGFSNGYINFNPQGPRGPRQRRFDRSRPRVNFNPQGPRGPRHLVFFLNWHNILISIHKALAGLDYKLRHIRFHCEMISIHKALAGLDASSALLPGGSLYFNPQGPRGPRQQNYPTIPPHPPNFLCIMSSPPYFNLLHPFTQPIFTAFPLFFRCESPGHFMLAWHSHLV